MANIQSAKKRARQAVARRAHNMSRRSMLRTAIKRVLEAIEKNDPALASTMFVAACSILDKSVKSGLIHKNKAARHKSHLSQKLKAIGAPSLLKTLDKTESKKEVKPVVKKAAKTTSEKPAKEKAEPKAKKEATAEKKPAAKAPAKKSSTAKAESKPKAKKAD